MALIEDYEQEQTSPIRIARNGSVTRYAEDERSSNGRSSGSMAFLDDDETLETNAAGTLTPRARPMPKRLSEEAREEAERQSRILQPVDEPPKARARRSKKAQAGAPVPRGSKEVEQMALPLKAPKQKTDSLVKQRQVLGFCCIVAAILVLLAIISYSPDDASRSETRISDLPSLFLPHGDAPDPVRDAVRASADQAKNWLGLIGAMLANFLINKTIGYAAVLYPIFFGAWSLAFFRFTYKQRRRLTLATTFFLLTAILFSATMGTASNFLSLPREWSGSVGQFLGIAFSRAIGGAGAFIIYAAAFIVMLIFSIDLDIEKTFHRLRGWWNFLVIWSRRKIIEFWEQREVRLAAKEARREAERLEEEAKAAEKTKTAEETQATEIIAEAIQPLDEVPAISPIRPISPTPAKVEAIFAEPKPAPIAEPATIPVSLVEEIPATRAEYQPLLKVRPAKLSDSASIPRLTRNSPEKLGTNSRHFSRLTNGALDQDEEQAEQVKTVTDNTIIVSSEAPSMGDAISNLEVATNGAGHVQHIPAEPLSADLQNIDSSEELIEPLKRKAREPKLTASEAPVLLGDEKVLSNEALPHSVASEIPIPPPTTLVKEWGAPKVGDDLFYEEGERPVVPENPYQEMLTKYRNPPLEYSHARRPERRARRQR